MTTRITPGGVAERLNAPVLKTGVALLGHRGFESHPHRCRASHHVARRRACSHHTRVYVDRRVCHLRVHTGHHHRARSRWFALALVRF